jgi:hypothetical protein
VNLGNPIGALLLVLVVVAVGCGALLALTKLADPLLVSGGF